MASPTPAPNIASPLSARSESRLSQVHPQLAARIRQMAQQAYAANLPFLVTQGLRTWKEQDALYAIGRTKPGKIVTKAKGGQSYHNFGLAVDILLLDALGKVTWGDKHPGWKSIATIGRNLGLEWGGDWTGFKDIPHYQYTNGVLLKECRNLYTTDAAGNPDFSAIWALVT